MSEVRPNDAEEESAPWDNRSQMADATSLEQRPVREELAGSGGAIELRGLWRAFGDRAVLRDVTIRVPAASTLAVLGPNGAGKTTLLRVLATLLRPTSGEASVLGCALPRDAWRARGRIGFLGHEPLLYRDLTGAENLRFFARLHGLPADGGERIDELLGHVRMSRRADELVRNLSAGMVQRLAVCRALLHDPELLLLDEPRSHLDPEAAALVEPVLGPIRGRTRVVVTHDVDAGLGEADLVVALRSGGSVAYAGPASGLSAGDARAIYGGAP
jgi:heme exporter protein A